ncbi:hypothetical protein [Acidisphaera sp. L21]|uniref:hypothetical protein n=1 Tax=Acidisphaera sp. L21 TaxID=1641851 RepID=UPI00131CDCF9|nr:hypothetical protein [Acidisphaera sp. L21]
MSDFSLTLGPVAFAGFELPSSITLGGHQRLAIHRLPGGLRIIDALGPDPADIAFSGIFTGPDAADRARLLDTLRVAGAALPLSWDAFFYTVIIETLEADYRSPWWIPYRLSCTVLRDEAAALVTSAIQLTPAISADLLAAGSFATAASVAIGTPGATTAGTAAYAAAQTTLATTLTGIDGQLAAAEPGLQSSDLPSATASAGLLAQLSNARAYTARAARNLSTAST